MKTKIEHTIKNNLIQINVYMKMKKYRADPTRKYGHKEILEYCLRNNLPVGELISSSLHECSNDHQDRCTGEWIFTIPKKYKKNLTMPKKADIMKKRTKARSARSRASAIATSPRRKTKQKVHQENEKNTEIKTNNKGHKPLE